jgi:hypothetical protein
MACSINYLSFVVVCTTSPINALKSAYLKHIAKVIVVEGGL